jgi:exosortase/archaeosortase family protein
MEQKKIFKDILVTGVILLSILPLVVTFSAVLTQLFNTMRWYTVLQKYVVPVESRLVSVIVKPIGIESQLTLDKTDYSMILIKSSTNLIPIRLEWNCLGWQSLILLTITFITGLKKGYTFWSKCEAVLIGVLGTFLANLFRMAFIVAVVYYWNSFSAFIIHDYFASLVALTWMLFFWWFSYSFVLQTKEYGSDANLNNANKY